MLTRGPEARRLGRSSCLPASIAVHFMALPVVCQTDPIGTLGYYAITYLDTPVVWVEV